MADVSGSSSAFLAAVERNKAGDAAGAEALLADAMREAKRRPGPASPEYARACYEYGSALAAFGQVRRAIAPMREACATDHPGDEAATKNQLTYLVQLGELLSNTGELDEAEAVLRRSLAGRLRFYGKEHAGYAFGLEPLAAVQLLRGALDDAMELADEALRNFAQNGHERLATSIALRAEIVKARQPDARAFPQIEAPDGLFEAIADAVFERPAADGAARREVLRELFDLVKERLGADHRSTLQALSHIANHEQSLGDEGDPERRVWAARELATAFDGVGDARQTLLCLLALALAQSDGGDQEGSLATYEDARARAKALGDPALRAKTLRNMGLLLSAMDRRPAAEKKLRAALKFGKEANDAGETAAARVALGIFLQHGGALDEARGLLQRALAALDPAHPDALCARSHLGAIESSSSCGCGDMTGSIAASLQQMVAAEIPEGLLDRLEVDFSQSEVQIGVHLLREPTPEELETLQSAVHRAEATLRERLKSGRSMSIELGGE